MQRFQVQLTDEQVRRLDARAAQEGKSRAALVREAVDAYLRTSRRLTRRELFERSCTALESLPPAQPGEPTDLSERHDHYFVEALLEQREAAHDEARDSA